MDDPDIKLGPLHIWILGREFPDSDDYWDANWLSIKAEVRSRGSYVSTQGPWLRTDELLRFTEQLEIATRDLKGLAELDCMEPYLGVKVCFTSLGHADLTIDITPDHLEQQHRYQDGSDQTYLSETIRGCRNVLRQHAVLHLERR